MISLSTRVASCRGLRFASSTLTFDERSPLQSCPGTMVDLDVIFQRPRYPIDSFSVCMRLRLRGLEHLVNA